MSLKLKYRAFISLLIIVNIFIVGVVSFAGTTNYTYDALNRLTKVEYGSGTTIVYTYDGVGNRLTMTSGDTTVCEPEAISVSPTSLKLKRKKSSEVTVTVTGANDCPVEGETVTATINAAGKKRITISPTSATTDASGETTFTITAKKKTGSARVMFKAGNAKKWMTVKISN